VGDDPLPEEVEAGLLEEVVDSVPADGGLRLGITERVEKDGVYVI